MTTTAVAEPALQHTHAPTKPLLHAFCSCMRKQQNPKAMCGNPKTCTWDKATFSPDPDRQCIVCIKLIHARATCPRCGMV